jgi:ATP-dependent DNA ligase
MAASAGSSGPSTGSAKQDGPNDSEPSVTSSKKADGRIPSRYTGAKGDPRFALPLDTPPMEARSSETLPIVDGPWQYEPKWDGFRCVAFKAGDLVELRAKSGKPLGRYFPEIIALLREVPAAQFVTDGELVIELQGRLAFDALQMRLHPAESRIRKLAAEIPARLVLFDMLAAASGTILIDKSLRERRKSLEMFMKKAAVPKKLVLSPFTIDHVKAMRWLTEAGDGATDGVIAKRLEDVYEAGKRTMIKVKRLRTADCVVRGFRFERNSQQIGSLLLGLYDANGKLDHVGFTSTITEAERPALTRNLDKLRGPPGFTGKAPGGPSRWSTDRSGDWVPVRPELVVEVRFDHVTGNRFRHGTKLVRWRPDKSPRQCMLEQILPPTADINT